VARIERFKKPLSSPELSAHAKLIWLEEAAVAVRLLGAAGGSGGIASPRRPPRSVYRDLPRAAPPDSGRSRRGLAGPLA